MNSLIKSNVKNQFQLWQRLPSWKLGKNVKGRKLIVTIKRLVQIFKMLQTLRQIDYQDPVTPLPSVWLA